MQVFRLFGSWFPRYRLSFTLTILYLIAPTQGAFSQSFEHLTATSPSGHHSVSVLVPDSAIHAQELGIVINTNDPQSVAVGEYYQSARGIPLENVVRVAFDGSSKDISFSAYLAVRNEVYAALGPQVQAIALTFTKPWRVGGCASTTTVMSTGVSSCGTNLAWNALGGAFGRKPFTELGFRPVMALAGTSFANVKLLIDRGIVSDSTFPAGDGYIVNTTDALRSSLVLHPALADTYLNYWNRPDGFRLFYHDNSDGASTNYIANKVDVLYYFIGLASVQNIFTNQYLPGALAHHPTSFGGQLVEGSGQMSILRWLEAGAAASYGTVVEPTANQYKFPEIRSVLSSYFRGATALEAYYYSVALHEQGIFVGEPLSRPYGPAQVSLSNDRKLQISTTSLDVDTEYRLLAGDTAQGPYTSVQSGITIGSYKFLTLSVPDATKSFYKVIQFEDRNAPTLRGISGIEDNETITGTSIVTVDAIDTGGISGMSVVVDGVQVGHDTTSPFSVEWDSTLFVNGSYSAQVVVHDNSGNTTSVSRVISIENELPAPHVDPTPTPTPESAPVPTPTPTPVPTQEEEPALTVKIEAPIRLTRHLTLHAVPSTLLIEHVGLSIDGKMKDIATESPLLLRAELRKRKKKSTLQIGVRVFGRDGQEASDVLVISGKRHLKRLKSIQVMVAR